MKNSLEIYKKHYVYKDDERLGLFLKLAEKYEVKNVLYPGSFVHITPSLVFPRVVYIDSYKKSADFFKDQTVYFYIQENKAYSQEAQVIFRKSDYSKDFGEREVSFDLLISQSAGSVSQACKQYLKIGGLLLVNNSHGDASMASIDSDYKLIAVYNRRKNKYTLSEKNLNLYFIPKSDTKVTKAYLEKTQRGIGYAKTASGYIFERVN
jgi:hypothetical protein